MAKFHSLHLPGNEKRHKSIQNHKNTELQRKKSVKNEIKSEQNIMYIQANKHIKNVLLDFWVSCGVQIAFCRRIDSLITKSRKEV